MIAADSPSFIHAVNRRADAEEAQHAAQDALYRDCDALARMVGGGK